MMNGIYDRYTSTSSLATGEDEVGVLAWSKKYFSTNYSKLLPSDKNFQILEVGCGYGRYISALLDMGYTNCYGIDLSPEQITYAKKKLQLSNVEQADALDWLRGKEAVYDCILCLDILEHLSTTDLLSLGEKMFRALKPGGIIIFQVPNGMSPFNPIIYGDLTHVRAFTPQSMQQFLLHVGFVPIGYYEIPPYVHGFRSAMQRVFWAGIIKPVISALVLALHGRVMGGNIYSSNFISCARK